MSVSEQLIHVHGSTLKRVLLWKVPLPLLSPVSLFSSSVTIFLCLCTCKLILCTCDVYFSRKYKSYEECYLHRSISCSFTSWSLKKFQYLDSAYQLPQIHLSASCIIPLNPLTGASAYSPRSLGGTWGTERLSDSPRVIQLVN